jgi:hypothetical protein
MLLEHSRRDFQKGRWAIAASVLNGDMQWRQRLGAGDKTGDIAGIGNISHFDARSPPNRGDALRSLTQLVVIPSRDDHGEPLRSEDARRRGTESARRSNTKDQDTALLTVRHDSLSRPTGV